MPAPEKSHGQKPERGPPRKRKPSWRMKLALALFGIGAALALLVVAEIVLRIVGAGTPPPLLIPTVVDADRILFINNQLFPMRFFFGRYEGRHTGVGEMNPVALWAPKPAGALRIVFAGDSTLQGFPHPAHLTAAAFTRAYLEDLVPGRPIEIVNLATTALASFAVAKTLEAAAPVAPDAVVAYVGHNEFFGAYGVASLSGISIGPLGCRLHYGFNQLRLVRVLSSLARSGSKLEVTERQLMEIMAAVEFLEPDDGRRAAAYDNLEANLAAMAEMCRAWGVPFIVCTTVRNEKDLPPVRSLEPAVGSPAAGRFRVLLGEGTPSSLAEAAKLFPGSALVAYRRGLHALELRRFDEARSSFGAAIDLDAMPWRACSPANAIIREAARRPGTFLADVEREFRDRSPNGILGDELLVDHVHPATEGHALMARAIVAALAAARPDLAIDPARLKPIPDYRRLLGDCPAVQHHVLASMAGLFAKEPLLRSNEARAAALKRRAEQSHAELHPAYRAAYDYWSDPRQVPRDKAQLLPLIMVAGDALGQRTAVAEADLPEALRLYEASIRGTPPYTTYRLMAVQKTLDLRARLAGSTSEADRALAREAAAMGRVMLRMGLPDTTEIEASIGQFDRTAR